jgi:hypothetical protein
MTPVYKEKFIAYIDIQGFSDKVDASADDPKKIAVLLAMLAKLSDGKERQNFEKYGPICCPEAPRLEKHLDYCVTQASDCVIISAEVSPAGFINLLNHCWRVSMALLQLGVLCRGFVTRGKVLHTTTSPYILGPGYQTALKAEAKVSAFKKRADESGTPFIELDDEVVDYVKDQPDRCVKEMFGRMTKHDGVKVAIFPFQRLNHEFGVGGIFGPFKAEEHLRSVNNIRGWIAKMKALVLANAEGGNEKVKEKAGHYLRALEQQLLALDETEKEIRMLDGPAVQIAYGRHGLRGK